MDMPTVDYGDMVMAQMAQRLEAAEAEIDRLRAALAPLAECHLPPAGYEHLGVTANFKTEQIIAAKEVMPNA